MGEIHNCFKVDFLFEARVLIIKVCERNFLTHYKIIFCQQKA